MRRGWTVLPIAFFFFAAIRSAIAGEAGFALQISFTSNLLLGIAILFRWRAGARVALLWLLVALLLWFWTEIVVLRELHAHCLLAHLGGTAVGMATGIRMPPERSCWPWAVAFGLLCQGLARLFTPPELNVDLAFAPFGETARIFPSYASYWAATIAVFSLSLFAVERALQSILRRIGTGSMRAASQAG